MKDYLPDVEFNIRRREESKLLSMQVKAGDNNSGSSVEQQRMNAWRLFLYPSERIDWKAGMVAPSPNKDLPGAARSALASWRLAMVTALSHRWRTLLDWQAVSLSIKDIEAVNSGAQSIDQIRGLHRNSAGEGEGVAERLYPARFHNELSGANIGPELATGRPGDPWVAIASTISIRWPDVSRWTEESNIARFKAQAREALELYRLTRRSLIRAVDDGLVDDALNILLEEQYPSSGKNTANHKYSDETMMRLASDVGVQLVDCYQSPKFSTRDGRRGRRSNMLRPTASLMWSLCRRTKRQMEVAQDKEHRNVLTNRLGFFRQMTVTLTQQKTRENLSYWDPARGDHKISSLLVPIALSGGELATHFPHKTTKKEISDWITRTSVIALAPTETPAQSDTKGPLSKRTNGFLVESRTSQPPTSSWNRRIGAGQPGFNEERLPAMYVNPDRLFLQYRGLSDYTPTLFVLKRTLETFITPQLAIPGAVGSVLRLHACGKGPHPATVAGGVLTAYAALLDGVSASEGRRAVIETLCKTLLQADIVCAPQANKGAREALRQQINPSEPPCESDWNDHLNDWFTSVSSESYGTAPDPEAGVDGRCFLPPATFLFIDGYLAGKSNFPCLDYTGKLQALLARCDDDISRYGAKAVAQWVDLLPADADSGSNLFLQNALPALSTHLHEALLKEDVVSARAFGDDDDSLNTPTMI